MDVKDRINKYIEFKGINVFSFEKSIGCSNGYWRKTKSISANILSEITRVYPDLSIDWAITGNGAIFKSDKNPIIKDRLRMFIEYHGLTELEFCRSINMPLSYYYKIEEKVSANDLKSILERYPRLNIEWLTTGVGSMYRRMQPINDRILTVMNKKYNEDPFEMCKAISVDKSVMIPILFNNDNPSSEIINLFIEKTGISSDWLLHGEGNMFKAIDSNTDYTERSIKKTAESLLEAKDVKQNTRPRIPYSASAGSLTSSVDGVSSMQCEQIPLITAFPSYDFTIHIKGDSMYPNYEGGDEVACKRIDSTSFIQWGKVHVLDTAQGIVIKRVYEDGEGIRCVSYNKEYPDFTIAKSEVYSMSLVVGLLRL